jgi:hypothetical protein
MLASRQGSLIQGTLCSLSQGHVITDPLLQQFQECLAFTRPSSRILQALNPTLVYHQHSTSSKPEGVNVGGELRRKPVWDRGFRWVLMWTQEQVKSEILSEHMQPASGGQTVGFQGSERAGWWLAERPGRRALMRQSSAAQGLLALQTLIPANGEGRGTHSAFVKSDGEFGRAH